MAQSFKEKLKSIPAIRRLGSGAKNVLRDLAAAEGYLSQRRTKVQDGPIRVGFLCQFIPAWSKLKPVYQLMLEDDRFEPVLICVPSNIQNQQLLGDWGVNDYHIYFENARLFSKFFQNFSLFQTPE